MPCSSAAHAPPARSISWNWVQAAVAVLFFPTRAAAGAGGGVRHPCKIRFFEQDELGVACNSSRETLGQAERHGERQHGYGVGAAEASGDDRDGRAQHVHVGVALGHHPPSGLGRDERRRRRELAGFLDACPQHPQRPELGDGQELVDIGGKAEINQAARGIERNPARFQRAQICNRHRQRVRQFLRFRAAGIVDRPAVNHCERPAKALRRQIGNGGVEDRHETAPRQRACAADRRGTDRVEAETDVGGGGSDAAALDQRRERASRLLHVRTEVEVERNAGVEVNALQRTRDRRLARCETVAVRASRSGEDHGEAGRTVFEVVQRLRIGRGRIGMIGALHDRPGRSRRAGGNRSGLRSSPVERFDRQPVIGLGDEPFVERRALEHVRHQPAPLFARGGGKLGSKGKVVGRGVRHGHKMPCGKWRANYKPPARARSVRKRTSSERGAGPRLVASRRGGLSGRTAERGRQSWAWWQLLDTACVHLRKCIAHTPAGDQPVRYDLRERR
jgi:hypothetical protein